jgi:hypothetical protein
VRSWQRAPWVAGIVFVVALVAESVVGVAIGLAHDDPAAKVARRLDQHQGRLIAITCLSVVYAPAFVMWLAGLHHRLRGETERNRYLGTLVLVGGTLMVAMHAFSDIGVTGLLGADVAGYRDQSLSAALYYLTFAVDSVGDVFGSLFLVSAGVLALESRALPRWLARLAMLAGVLLFFQGFGLGGIVGTFGLVIDGIGFVLFLVFVLASSVNLLRRG